jgi:hypothetical protein
MAGSKVVNAGPATIPVPHIPCARAPSIASMPIFDDYSSATTNMQTILFVRSILSVENRCERYLFPAPGGMTREIV